MENNVTRKNYLKQAPVKKDRTIRLEVIGEVTADERHFLDGMLHIAAGAMRKDDKFVRVVSAELAKVARALVEKMKKEMEGE